MNMTVQKRINMRTWLGSKAIQVMDVDEKARKGMRLRPCSRFKRILQIIIDQYEKKLWKACTIILSFSFPKFIHSMRFELKMRFHYYSGRFCGNLHSGLSHPAENEAEALSDFEFPRC
ncbi:hypothetical protein Ocin01_19007 [Orchesella cincta]|uniref:Uncharacterized protein n=1 Tax=Orchesella cincta TaxID=48709 RepID=A0A1D2M3X3_ORCCI|nr:hypothetical protein Ocin01_19007 [Orchesella cincta]